MKMQVECPECGKFVTTHDQQQSNLYALTHFTVGMFATLPL